MIRVQGPRATARAREMPTEFRQAKGLRRRALMHAHAERVAHEGYAEACCQILEMAEGTPAEKAARLGVPEEQVRRMLARDYRRQTVEQLALVAEEFGYDVEVVVRAKP